MFMPNFRTYQEPVMKVFIMQIDYFYRVLLLHVSCFFFVLGKVTLFTMVNAHHNHHQAAICLGCYVHGL
jgi:hypothetical protein